MPYEAELRDKAPDPMQVGGNVREGAPLHMPEPVPDELPGDPSAADLAARQKGVDTLARLAAEWFTFEGLRQALMTRGIPDPYVVCPGGGDVRDAVLRLLAPTRPDAEVGRTYVALRHALSSHREIAIASDGMGEASLPHSPGALQALLNARNDVFARWHDFQSEMQRIGMTLCQIRVDETAVGTGFLVSDQHVLTAFHCVASLVVDGKALAGSDTRLTITFDDVKMPGATRGAWRTDVKAARAWLAACSPPDAQEDQAPSPPSHISPDCLDFALIQLAEPAGRLASKLQATPRKWLNLDDLALPPTNQTQVLVAHHPGGSDLRLSVGLFRDHCDADLRVRYLAPTVVGSSGAPCFSIEWKPYALHNAGYDLVPINQGVPLCLIRQAIQASGALTKAGPALRLIPPIGGEGEPILGRQDLSLQLELMLGGSSPARAINITADEHGGKRYTGRLMRAVVNDAGHPAFLLNMQKFSADTPEAFANRLIEEIRPGAPPAAMPPTPDSRQRARWVSRRLAEWVRQGLAAGSGDAVAAPALAASDIDAPLSIWLIFEDCRQAPLSTETQDLLLALLGLEDDEGSPNLRLAFLDYPGSFAALAPELVWHSRLALLSGSAVEPYMALVLRSLGVEETPEAITASATELVDMAQSVGINSLPLLVKALRNWTEKRTANVRQQTGGSP